VLCEARASDPITSKAAAASLDHGLKPTHAAVISWLKAHGPATDDEIAVAMVAQGHTARTEVARRWVRTLRERHELIAPALDVHGGQSMRENESGRMAQLWRIAP
jgi:hypothetical protein